MDQQLVTLGAPPAHLANVENRLNVNAAARANMLASFAVLKIRGKAWRVRYRGDEQLITGSAGTGHDGRPLPETPVQYVDVVIVAAASAISKKWYAGGYSDGVSQAPDCFSVNGISPDPASADKQSVYCATCPQNIWGSATTERGRKAKACRDGRRIAVVPIVDVANADYGGPMLLDIPPTSLASLEMYVRTLERLGADASGVVTRIGFNPAVTHQELTFKTIGWVEDPADYAMVVEHAHSDVVSRMLEASVEEVTTEPAAKQVLGQRPAHITQLRPGPTAALQAEEKPEEKPIPTPPPPPPAPAQPPPAAAVRKSGFGTRPAAQGQPQVQVPIPAAAQAPAPAPTLVQGAPPSLEAEIDNLLAGC